MVEIHNLRYYMRMMGGFQGDCWCPFGNVVGHPNFPDWSEVTPSSITSFNEEDMTFKTLSGREYQIVGKISEETREQLRKDVSKGYERY